MRATQAAQQRFGHAHRRTLAHAVSPGTGAVDDPGSIDALLFSRDLIAQQQAGCAAVAYIDGESFHVIADNRAGVHRFEEPLRDQPLGKFALRVFIVEQRPAMPRVERPFELLQLHGIGILHGQLAGYALVEP